jgi:phospholipid transport system substrate-binding protein
MDLTIQSKLDERMELTSKKSCRRHNRFGSFIALGFTVAFVLAVAGSSPAPAATREAMGQVKTLVDRAIGVLKDKRAPRSERQRELRNLVEAQFDFNDMARSVLGYHWRDLSPAKRAEFISLFKAFIEDAYLSKIQDYSGQQVQFIGETSENPGYVQVQSKIVQAGKDPIPLNYRLRQENGSWKIYDVTVDNISIIANYRNQFNRVINDDGFDKLMTDMRNKQQELAASLGGR